VKEEQAGGRGLLFSHLTGVLCFEAGVVDESNMDGVAAAQ